MAAVTVEDNHADADALARIRRLCDLAGLDTTDDAAADITVGITGTTVTVDAPGAETLTLTIPGDDEHLLTALIGLTPARARMIGVLGASGGLGASIVTIVVGLVAQRAGQRAAVVDLDPAGAGLDVMVGIEHDPGTRWADIRQQAGTIVPSRLVHNLPRAHGVAFLSADQFGGAGLTEPVAANAIRALAQSHDVVVLDLPRQTLGPGGASWLPTVGCTDVLLLAGQGLRGEIAARNAVQALRDQSDAVQIHLLAPPQSPSCDHEALVSAAGVPIAGVIRRDKRIDSDIERGVCPGVRPRAALVTSLRTAVADLGLVP